MTEDTQQPRAHLVLTMDREYRTSATLPGPRSQPRLPWWRRVARTDVRIQTLLNLLTIAVAAVVLLRSGAVIWDLAALLCMASAAALLAVHAWPTPDDRDDTHGLPVTWTLDVSQEGDR